MLEKKLKVYVMNLSAINSVKSQVKTSGISPFLELEINKIYPNPNQPRKAFNEIEELAQSIITNGLIQPIAVVKTIKGYMIISGERRYKASQLARLKTIKAHVINADDKKILELTLVENIQRDDLTDFEKAKHISILWNGGEYSKKQDLAKAIGKSSSYISKAFSCLRLDNKILQDLEQKNNDIPLTVLEEISRIKDKHIQAEVYHKYLNGEIVRDDIKNYKLIQKISRGKKYKKKVLSTDLVKWEDFLPYLKPLDISNKSYKITIEEI